MQFAEESSWVEALQFESVNLGILSRIWLSQCETVIEVGRRLGMGNRNFSAYPVRSA
jgi:hypothetical protein